MLDSWNAEVRAGELPTRCLCSVVVFEAVGEHQVLRDLQALDAPQPPTLTIVGRLTRLGADGGVDLEAAQGPLLRLTATEWSVEYDDDVRATVWASTENADYQLVSPWAPYAALWDTLKRKTELAARSIALLLEDKSLTYKQLLKHVVGLNIEPDSIKLKPEEMATYGHFVLDQVQHTEGLADCRAAGGLRQALELAAGGGVAAKKTVEAEVEAVPDPNKRQRKATKLYDSSVAPAKKRQSFPPNPEAEAAAAEAREARKEKKRSEAEWGEPEKPQSAFWFFNRAAREVLKREAQV